MLISIIHIINLHQVGYVFGTLYFFVCLSVGLWTKLLAQFSCNFRKKCSMD